MNMKNCDNIIVLWEDDTFFGDLKFFEEHIGGKNIAGWEAFINVLKNERYFVAFYKLNCNNISYISCEFCNKNLELEPYIIVKDKSGCLEILEIPAEILVKMGRACGDGQRICLMDINFDGYNDIIFLGYNDGLELYHHCIGFLWNQSKQQFELEKTVQSHFDYIETERKRLTFTSSPSASEDSYRIYEYINGEFEEKRLDVTFDLNEENLKEITWEYYENEIFLEKLILNYSEDGNGYYAFYGRDGNISEGVFPKEQMYSELGKQYFEEFDFYNHG